MADESTSKMLHDNTTEAPTRSDTNDFVHRFRHNRDVLVAIVDSDLATCETLSLLFRLEGYRTQFDTSLEEFEGRADLETVDVAIVSMSMLEGQDVWRIVRQLRMTEGRIRLFLLAEAHHPIPDVVEAMRAGAASVVTRPIDREHLLQMVGRDMQRKFHHQVDPDGREHLSITGPRQLTPREREIVTRIVDGNSNKEAARSLGISPRTVEVHRRAAMRKLGARNTAELVRIILTL